MQCLDVVSEGGHAGGKRKMQCLTDVYGEHAMTIPDGKDERRRMTRGRPKTWPGYVMTSRHGTYQYLLMLLLQTHDAGRPILDKSLRPIHAVIHFVNASTVRRLCEEVRHSNVHGGAHSNVHGHNVHGHNVGGQWTRHSAHNSST